MTSAAIQLAPFLILFILGCVALFTKILLNGHRNNFETTIEPGQVPQQEKTA